MKPTLQQGFKIPGSGFLTFKPSKVYLRPLIFAHSFTILIQILNF